MGGRQPEYSSAAHRPAAAHEGARAVVRFQTARGTFDGMLNGTPIATALLRHLPLTSTARRWGEEIYFDVPVQMPNTQPTLEVQVGDLAYWPEGPCLCIFFGKTPVSRGREPRPASAVTVVGHTAAPVALLRSIADGNPIVVAHASPPQDQTV
ncbi:MAG: cyclophilin-like fold protein [Candidatus Omnitrophota bacterium]|nr:cyclophilin-like fold protein [Candidatus Omnitrophota bacterium]